MEETLLTNQAYHELVECIISALDARDRYTGHHSRRVSDLACQACRLLQLPEAETQEIHLAAHLHDIGKIGIPDAVLLKPGRLEPAAWEMMQQHPQIGADILARSPRFARAAAMILHHHERFDGSGYPFGAKGTEIPVGARIIAICDSIDAMTSARAYRAARSLSDCRTELAAQAGRMYDPDLAAVFLQNWQVVEQVYASAPDSSCALCTCYRGLRPDV